MSKSEQSAEIIKFPLTETDDQVAALQEKLAELRSNVKNRPPLPETERERLHLNNASRGSAIAAINSLELRQQYDIIKEIVDHSMVILMKENTGS